MQWHAHAFVPLAPRQCVCTLAEGHQRCCHQDAGEEDDVRPAATASRGAAGAVHQSALIYPVTSLMASAEVRPAQAPLPRRWQLNDLSCGLSTAVTCDYSDGSSATAGRERWAATC